MNIGENMKMIRESRNISQCELAERIYVRQSTICQIERGTRALTLPLAVQITKVLDCTIDDLIA